jgi:hypothetical protein
MKNKKSKFSIEQIYKSLNGLDLHCYWFDILHPKYKNQIGFDNDRDGNGNGPYLELTCYSEYVRFTHGTHLKKDEKKLIYSYCDYDNVDDFADRLAEFIIKYFKSIKLTYTRSKSR